MSSREPRARCVSGVSWARQAFAAFQLSPRRDAVASRTTVWSPCPVELSDVVVNHMPGHGAAFGSTAPRLGRPLAAPGVSGVAGAARPRNVTPRITSSFVHRRFIEEAQRTAVRHEADLCTGSSRNRRHPPTTHNISPAATVHPESHQQRLQCQRPPNGFESPDAQRPLAARAWNCPGRTGWSLDVPSRRRGHRQTNGVLALRYVRVRSVARCSTPGCDARVHLAAGPSPTWSLTRVVVHERH